MFLPFPLHLFPNQKKTIVGGFLFLRFFCPALLTPKPSKILDENPPPLSRRGLILIAKVMKKRKKRERGMRREGIEREKREKEMSSPFYLFISFIYFFFLKDSSKCIKWFKIWTKRTIYDGFESFY